MSYNHGPIYMQGDKVYYTGEKLRGELSTREGKAIPGWIHASVLNEPDKFVVWFPDTKESDSYVMSMAVLSKWRPAKNDVQKGPIVEHMPNRRKKEDD